MPNSIKRGSVAEILPAQSRRHWWVWFLQAAILMVAAVASIVAAVQLLPTPENDWEEFGGILLAAAGGLAIVYLLAGLWLLVGRARDRAVARLSHDEHAIVFNSGRTDRFRQQLAVHSSAEDAPRVPIDFSVRVDRDGFTFWDGPVTGPTELAGIAWDDIADVRITRVPVGHRRPRGISLELTEGRGSLDLLPPGGGWLYIYPLSEGPLTLLCNQIVAVRSARTAI